MRKTAGLVVLISSKESILQETWPLVRVIPCGFQSRGGKAYCLLYVVVVTVIH